MNLGEPYVRGLNGWDRFLNSGTLAAVTFLLPVVASSVAVLSSVAVVSISPVYRVKTLILIVVFFCKYVVETSSNIP